MRKSEKIVMGLALAAIGGVIALTVVLEMERGKTGGPATAASTPTMVIPGAIMPDELPDPASAGAKAYGMYCMQCHDLPQPSMHTADEWRAVLTRMSDHIDARHAGGMMSRMIVPTARDWTMLEQYLARHAQLPFDTARLADIGSPAGQAFVQTCSQCHAAPDPARHTGIEWARTVLRMQSHMERMGKPVPDQARLDQIVTFLQQHAKTDGG